MQDHISHIINKIKIVEQENNFYKMKVHSIYLWDIIRFDISQKVQVKKNIINVPHDYDSKRIKYFSQIFIDVFYFIKALVKITGQGKIIYFSHNRRKYNNSDKKWIDIYIDPIYKRSKYSCIVEYRIKNEKHKKNLKNPVEYLDFDKYIIKVLFYLIKYLSPLSEIDKKNINIIIRKLNNKLDIVVIDYKYLEKRLYQFLATKMYYKAILKICRTEKIYLTTSYGKDALIAACKDVGVNIMEIQHGIINKNHLGYDFEGESFKHYIPNIFLAFGPYWVNNVRFSKNITIISNYGFKYLNSGIEKYKKIEKLDWILVISQGTIGSKLAEFVGQMTHIISKNVKIKYKLHPGEINNWKIKYPDLNNEMIEVIDNEYNDLYEIMAKSRWQMGVNSTALYEGMEFGCKTIIVKIPGFEDLIDLIDKKCAILIDDPKLINSVLNENIDNKDFGFFYRE